MLRGLPSLSRSDWEHLIDEWILSERYRGNLKRKILDDWSHERIAEREGLSLVIGREAREERPPCWVEQGGDTGGVHGVILPGVCPRRGIWAPAVQQVRRVWLVA